jgi:hypothetical protein
LTVGLEAARTVFVHGLHRADLKKNMLTREFEPSTIDTLSEKNRYRGNSHTFDPYDKGPGHLH